MSRLTKAPGVTVRVHRNGSISFKSRGGVDLRGIVEALAGKPIEAPVVPPTADDAIPDRKP